MEPADATCLRQTPSRVVRFYSQYGSSSGSAYTASNICKEPGIFPNYQESSSGFLSKTYGLWWSESAHTTQPFGPPCSLYPDNFIEVNFRKLVIPHRLDLYEVHCPGSLVRVVAFNGEADGLTKIGWRVLWQGKPEKSSPVSRKFSPPLMHCNFATKNICLEFDFSHADSYVCLDAVVLYGSEVIPDSEEFPSMEDLEDATGSSPLPLYGGLNDVIDFWEEPSSLLEAMESNGGYFKSLPDKCIMDMFRNLTLPDLFRAGAVCRRFRNVCLSKDLYREINLKPYWFAVNDELLSSLLRRVGTVHKLDMSWCCHQNFSNGMLLRFFRRVCSKLEVLRLACFDLPHTIVIEVLGLCQHLKELDLSGTYIFPCRLTTMEGNMARLVNLQKLSLYRSRLSNTELAEVVRKCPNIQHLDLGMVNVGVNGSLLDALCQSNRKPLLSLSLWQNEGTTGVSLLRLLSCHRQIEDLELGWCQHLSSERNLILLLKPCFGSIRRLGLAGLRIVGDEILSDLSAKASNLQHLDVTGTMVTLSGISSLLSACESLRWLDVSYCAPITVHAGSLSGSFPHVHINAIAAQPPVQLALGTH